MGDVLNNCPRCSDDLPWGATSCHCGWKKRARGEGKKKLPPRVPVQCAHENCPDDATIRVKTTTGWADLCRGHYAAHYLRVARDWCHARGLVTVSQMRAYIREMLPKIRAATPSRDWMDRVNQAGVNVLIATGDKRTIAELLERGVIEDDGRLIPVEQRTPKQAPQAPNAEAA